MNRRFIAVLLVSVTAGCAGTSKLDLSQVGRRAAWQHPDEVVHALGVRPGDHVADLGAGDGYFVPYLARAVGPTGVVYAVDVDADAMLLLAELVEEEGLDNVEIVLGDYHDPRLPNGSLDCVLLVNSYHHIEERPAYLEQLWTDLERGGRVGVIEPNEETDGVLGLFLSEGHTSTRHEIRAEMTEAGYSHSESFDFLPVQVFEVFTAEARTALPGR